MVQQRHHKWDVVGREYEANIPNIWVCSKCGLVRAEGWTRRHRERGAVWWDHEGDERFIKEYSAADGEFLTDGRKVPQCVAGEYT